MSLGTGYFAVLVVRCDAEYAFSIVLRKSEFAGHILEFVILAVERFPLRSERGVLLFELVYRRQFLYAKLIKILLRRPVQDDVGGVDVIECVW